MTGYIKERLAADGTEFSFVVYVGDGMNDLCPMTKLTEKDLVCVRNAAACLLLDLWGFFPGLPKDRLQVGQPLKRTGRMQRAQVGVRRDRLLEGRARGAGPDQGEDGRDVIRKFTSSEKCLFVEV